MNVGDRDIVIEPVTRINGSARVRVLLDGEGHLQEVRFQAFGYRGFEQMAVGSHIDNLLPIVSRICGGDSLFHQIAAAEAVERAVGYTVPAGALRLRELAMWGQLFERHAVSLTVHSLPDLLFPSSDPGVRNIISIHRVDEEVVRKVMALKSLGTSVLREAGGRAVHPVNFIPGGAVRAMAEDRRKMLMESLIESRGLLMETVHLIKLLLRRNEEAVETLGVAPTTSLSLKGEEGIALLGNKLEAMDPEGETLGVFEPEEAANRVTENDSPHSHIRSAGLSEIGEVRVGPLARININRRYGTQLADAELEEIKSLWGFPLHQTMINHAARMVEMIHAWEKMVEILGEPPGETMRRGLSPSAGRGAGVVESPEGTLIYDLLLDGKGLVERLNIIAPLQFNLQALERSLAESARNLLGDTEPGERTRNRLEMAVRAYAPCIPCGIH